MQLQRAIGILVILTITLLIIPNVNQLIQNNDNLAISTDQAEDEPVTEIKVEQEDKFIKIEQPAPPIAVSPQMPAQLASNPIVTITKPINSKILDEAIKKKLDISSLVMPDLPQEKIPLIKPKKKQKIVPIYTTKEDGEWEVRIASLKANKPFQISNFKQVLAKEKIKFITYNYFMNGTKWVRFVSTSVLNKQQAIRLKNHINKRLSEHKINATIYKK